LQAERRGKAVVHAAVGHVERRMRRDDRNAFLCGNVGHIGRMQFFQRAEDDRMMRNHEFRALSAASQSTSSVASSATSTFVTRASPSPTRKPELSHASCAENGAISSKYL
jgi:hypothetical protein